MRLRRVTDATGEAPLVEQPRLGSGDESIVTRLVTQRDRACLVGLAVGVLASTGWRLDRTWETPPGAAITTLPNYQVWVKDVNDAGGLNVGGKKMKIEVIEYDDRSNSEELIKAVERLATQDKVDFILAPWSTGMNLAVAPIFNKYGYPHLAVTANSNRSPGLTL